MSEPAPVSRPVQWTLDVHDLPRMAAFWAGALGYRIELDHDRPGTCSLVPPDDAPPKSLPVWLQPPAGPKTTKNRSHVDLRPTGDFDAELGRLLVLGARPADVGQAPDDPFVVLQDPEDNEFCLLRP